MESNVFPVPTRERFTRWLMYAGVGAAAVGGLIFIAPVITAALVNAFALGKAVLALGALAVGMGISGLVVYNFAPLVKQFIEIRAYKMWESMIDAYPIIHMRLWLAMVLDGIEESKKAKNGISGIVGENTNQVKQYDERIRELKTAIADKRVSQGTRDAAMSELASLMELRKPYESVVSSLEPAVEGLDRFIEIQNRYADKLKQEINTADAKWRADANILEGLKIFGRVMGNTQAKVNSEAAKRRVEQQLGNSLGQLDGIRKQMGVMVQAAAQKDEIAVANARKFMEDQMRAIDVPFVEVKPTAAIKAGGLLNLN